MTQAVMNFDAPAPVRQGKAAQLAALFRANPNRWIDGMELARIGGQYAWRTRVSDLRRAPWRMDIENQERMVSDAYTGRRWKVSEYRYRTEGR